MARRRLTLRTYLRRRWRLVGFVLVLGMGALLLLAITDRGHDPLWSARQGHVEALSIAPDGEAVYVLTRDAPNGPVTRLQALAGAGGDVVWQTDMNASGALVAADYGGVVVATDFPRAFVTFTGADGRPRFSVPLEGEPRALAVERGRVAVALQAGSGGAVLVVEEGRIVRTHHFGASVNALDLRAQHLAVGTSAGRVFLFAADGAELHNLSVGLDVHSVRLSADAQALVAGGANLSRGADLSGGVAFVDARDEPPVRWMLRTSSSVVLVDLDAEGRRAIAVEESTTRHRLHAYDASGAREAWSSVLAGLVATDDAGRGGAAISPDGRTVVVGTLRGSLRALDGETGAPLWAYQSDGTTTVAFRQTSPALFAANARLLPSGPMDTVLLFSPAREPFGGTVFALGGLVAGALALGGFALLGAGYWRLRRAS